MAEEAGSSSLFRLAIRLSNWDSYRPRRRRAGQSQYSLWAIDRLLGNPGRRGNIPIVASPVAGGVLPLVDGKSLIARAVVIEEVVTEHANG